ncbi:MAG: hypothetical protein H6721_28470 [Sandaracinus sp.]|nr:hypothetical protein [Sandaracinus sp.]MCB9618819.1 hypothetical protein [Sandaracinus sp.]MCB9636065.1 hypothetical protein [Sandaracinus sp.]
MRIVLALASVLVVSTAAHAQVGGRASLYGTAGFGGRVDADVDDAPDLDVGDRDLSASFGGGARLEMPVIGPLMLGGQIEHRRVEVTPYNDALIGNGSGREGVTDFDLWASLNFSPVRGPVGLDLYLGVPFGPSLLTADDYRARGLNVGAMAGVRLLFGPVGLFVEGGYRRHMFLVRENTPDYRTYWQQAVVNAGAAFRF